MILITDLKTRHINNHDSCAHREEISFSFSSCFLGKTAQEEDDSAVWNFPKNASRVKLYVHDQANA